MSGENGDAEHINKQKMQRLNLFAVITGMAAVSFFLLALILAVFFPPLPPASTPPLASPTRALTLTATLTLTPTPTLSPTVTPAPRVELIEVEYLQPGAGCQVDVTVNISGDALTGSFHVWNASYDDPAGAVFDVESLPPGLSNGYILTLDGDQPAFYTHEIWFEYSDGVSNRLTGLACPELTPSP